MRVQELFENRLDWIRNNFEQQVNSHKLSFNDATELNTTDQNTFDFLVDIDPTTNKQNLQWLIRLFLKGNFKLEDAQKARNNLKWFEDHKHKLSSDLRDINKYKGINEIFQVKQGYEEDEEEKSKEDYQKLINEMKGKDWISTFIDNSRIGIYVPDNYEASKALGKNTDWCTAYTNTSKHFDYYTKQGPLFVIWDKTDNKKYQIHVQSDQAMDQTDTTISDIEEFVNDYSQILSWSYFTNQFHKQPEEKWNTLAPLALTFCHSPNLVLWVDSYFEDRVIEKDPEAIKLVNKNGYDSAFWIKFFSNLNKDDDIDLDEIPYTRGNHLRRDVEVGLISNDSNFAKRYNIETEEAQQLLVDEDLDWLEYIKQPTEHIQLYSVEKDPQIITSRRIAENLSKHVIRYAEDLIDRQNQEDEEEEDENL